jgi:hypothetical protein
MGWRNRSQVADAPAAWMTARADGRDRSSCVSPLDTALGDIHGPKERVAPVRAPAGIFIAAELVCCHVCQGKMLSKGQWPPSSGTRRHKGFIKRLIYPVNQVIVATELLPRLQVEGCLRGSNIAHSED